MAFVVVSLASWFGVLGLFGQYLPANATATNRQMIVNMHGNQLTSHWIKKNGRWQFLKISKIVKLDGGKLQRTASLRKLPKVNSEQGGGPVAAPRTTASVAPLTQRRINKKALRAKLADEIGRWSKIGNRWEWRATGKTAQPVQPAKRPAQRGTREHIDYLEQSKTPYSPRLGAHWIQRDGRWSFEMVVEHTILRNI